MAASDTLNDLIYDATVGMMVNLYTYTSGGALNAPSSYSMPTLFNSTYQFHKQNTCIANWPSSSIGGVDTQLIEVETTAVSETASISKASAGSITTAECKTDCSGWVTSVLAYVNASSNGAKPSFACGVGDAVNDAKDFFNCINTGSDFTSVAKLADIKKGDFVCVPYTSDEDSAGDSGHIMVVVDFETEPDTKGVTHITVVDQANVDDQPTIGHNNDTRVSDGTNVISYTPGLGMGVVGLVYDSSTSTYDFYWRATDSSPFATGALIGRANTASST